MNEQEIAPARLHLLDKLLNDIKSTNPLDVANASESAIAPVPRETQTISVVHPLDAIFEFLRNGHVSIVKDSPIDRSALSSVWTKVFDGEMITKTHNVVIELLRCSLKIKTGELKRILMVANNKSCTFSVLEELVIEFVRPTFGWPGISFAKYKDIGVNTILRLQRHHPLGKHRETVDVVLDKQKRSAFLALDPMSDTAGESSKIPRLELARVTVPVVPIAGIG